MGGPARLVFHHPTTSSTRIEELCRGLQQELQALEQKLSRYRPDSVISQINQRAGTGLLTPIDAEVAALLRLCDQLWRESDGAFDATAGVLRTAWSFGDRPEAAPEKLPQLLPLVNWQGVDINETGVCLSCRGMELDLGGVGKEYAVDKGVDWLLGQKLSNFVLELAGDVRAVGGRPDGQPWQVGIRDPGDPENALITVSLSNAALATSGTTARTLVYQGRQLSHLLDARTGWPVDHVASVSAISSTCITAGAVATLACVQPPDAAEEWLRASGLPWLRVASDGTLSGPLARSSAEVGGA